jgi:hypothetical protein
MNPRHLRLVSQPSRWQEFRAWAAEAVPFAAVEVAILLAAVVAAVFMAGWP